MRLIGILLALLILGLLITRKLEPGSPVRVEESQHAWDLVLPKAPVNAAEVRQLGEQLNEVTEKRAARLEEAASR